jgi:hypothetical protein
MNVKILKLSRKDRVSKAGKPFVSLGIMTDQHGDKWLSGFDNETTNQWQVGDTVDIEIKTNGDYLNFMLPKKVDSSPAMSNGATAEIKNILMLKVIPMLQDIQDRLPANVKYPEMDSTNDAHGSDEYQF